MIKKISHLSFKTGFTPLDISNKANSNSRPYLTTGFTLIEAMCAILLLAIVAIGTAGYRYYSALDVRRAEKESTAARIALLLNESWRGIRGDTSSTTITTTIPSLGNPLIVINRIDSGAPAAPAGFTVMTDGTNLSYYKVVVDSATYFVTMSYKDVDSSSSTHVCRALNIGVGWPVTSQETTYHTTDYWLFTLTTYVERSN